MSLNLAALVSGALTTAKRYGLAGVVTITRVIPEDYVPSTDTATNPVVTSFSANAVGENVDADQPNTGGTDPQQGRKWTIAASDCAFAPESGHTLTVNGKESRVLAVQPIAPNGVDVAMYIVEVAG